MMAETVALGAAYAAGLAVGYWPDRQVLRRHWQRAGEWRPTIDPDAGPRNWPAGGMRWRWPAPGASADLTP